MPTSQSRQFTIDVVGGPIVGRLYGAGPGATERPAVVLCPGFSGTQDTPTITAVAQAFATAGLAAVTFDYRGFGMSGGEPRQVVSVPEQLQDIRSVLHRVRALPEVDARHTALWGTSLGGGHVVTVAAADSAVAAVVAQIPFNGVPRKAQGRTKRDSYALLWAAVRDRVRGRLGRPPLYVKAVGDPDELAVMASREANATVAALESATWRNQVAPRGLLDMMRYRPGRHVRRLHAPLLVCIGTEDQETPGDTGRQLAEDAPHGQLRSYPVGHFEVYRPDIRDQVLRDQTEFLLRALVGG